MPTPTTTAACALESDLVTRIDDARMSARVEGCMERVTDRNRQLLALRFHEDLTLEQIGARFSVTKQNVRQVLRRTLDRLRRCAAEGPDVRVDRKGGTS